MNDNGKDVPCLDPHFRENSDNFPDEELRKYIGQWIAWSLDGTQILASGLDLLTLEERLKAMGIDPSCVVSEHLPQADSIIGGILSE